MNAYAGGWRKQEIWETYKMEFYFGRQNPKVTFFEEFVDLLIWYDGVSSVRQGNQLVPLFGDFLQTRGDLFIVKLHLLLIHCILAGWVSVKKSNMKNSNY